MSNPALLLLSNSMDHVRGDSVCWLAGDDPGAPAHLPLVLRQMDRVVLEALPSLLPPYIRKGCTLQRPERAMLTVYPPGGSRYCPPLHTSSPVALFALPVAPPLLPTPQGRG